MGFKDQVNADVSSVFHNTGDFADTLVVDGASVACILDETGEASNGSPGLRNPPRTDGVDMWDATLRIAVGLIDRPVNEQRLTIGDRKANVVEVGEEQGELIIRLRWWDS